MREIPRIIPYNFDTEKAVAECIKLTEHVIDRVLKILSESAPRIESWLIDALETIFAPRLMLRHLLAAMALQLGLVSCNILKSCYVSLVESSDQNRREHKQAVDMMNQAETFEEWKAAAEKVDDIEGHSDWRRRPESLLYDYKFLKSQIDELNFMMQRDDVFGLMFRLRGSLSRNQHGILHEGLFSRAHAGTKMIVEEYHDTVCKALRYITSTHGAIHSISNDVKLSFFNETRHSYGRTALMLSGGASMGFYHTGVVKALMEQNLMPKVISGASAGSIVAAMVGTRTDSELKPMFRGLNIRCDFFQSKREMKRISSQQTNRFKHEAFWQFLVPPALRWAGEFFWDGLLSGEGILRMNTEHFRSVMQHNVGQYTFQEAFDRTGKILNVIVAPRNRTDPPRLLNYLTAPHVLVWSAVVCSCGVPGVFEASTLLVKEADGSIRPEHTVPQKYVDGSMEADLPMQQISELFNINHFLVSQVNPHAALFSTLTLSKSIWNHPVYSFLVGVVGFLRAQVRNWFRNVLEFISLRRMAPVWATRRGGIQLLTQEYEGRESDVTISPWYGSESLLSSFTKMLRNPTDEEFQKMVAISERNTWPKIEMIRVHCAVEVALEQCVQSVRKQIVAEGQAEAARLSTVARASYEKNLITSLSKKMRTGRVPSFFTSRSMVGISNLSLSGQGSSVHFPYGTERVRKPSEGYFNQNSNHQIGMSLTETGTSAGRLQFVTENILSDSVDCSELQDVVGEDDLPTYPAFYSDNEDAVAHSIVRSSSMSKFYYRRASTGGLNGFSGSAGTLSLRVEQGRSFSESQSSDARGTTSR